MIARGPLLGEFMGTFVVMLLGNGVVAGVLLKKSKAENAGWMVITTAWGFAVLSGIFVAQLFGSPDAHLNPAFTFAAAIKTGAWHTVLPYCAAQVGGAFLGAVATWLFFLPHWRVTDDPGAKLGVFATSPAIRSYGSNLFCEVLATFVLVLVGRRHELEAGANDGRGGGPESTAGQLPRVGRGPVAWRDYRLRHQSCARPGATAGALGFADCRQGRQ